MNVDALYRKGLAALMRHRVFYYGHQVMATCMLLELCCTAGLWIFPTSMGCRQLVALVWCVLIVGVFRILPNLHSSASACWAVPLFAPAFWAGACILGVFGRMSPKRALIEMTRTSLESTPDFPMPIQLVVPDQCGIVLGTHTLIGASAHAQATYLRTRTEDQVQALNQLAVLSGDPGAVLVAAGRRQALLTHKGILVCVRTCSPSPRAST